MNILMIGASGSGKGTQAKLLVDKYGFCHLSMGDVLKEQVKLGTKEGKIIDEYQRNGNLVPLEITVKALENKIEATKNDKGYLLDGFPRNMEQVKLLKIKVDLVLNFVNDLERLRDRLVNRRVCKDCNGNCHVSKLKNGKCPVCGGEVYQRTDDNDASITKRLDFYRKEVMPVAEYYHRSNIKTVDIDADKTINEVAEQIERAIKEVKND